MAGHTVIAILLALLAIAIPTVWASFASKVKGHSIPGAVYFGALVELPRRSKRFITRWNSGSRCSVRLPDGRSPLEKFHLSRWKPVHPPSVVTVRPPHPVHAMTARPAKVLTRGDAFR